MNSRIPEYFQLDKYHISPEDVVQCYLHCMPDDIHSKVVVMPTWGPEIFSVVADNISEVVPDVWQIEYQGQKVSLIRSGVGAPITGEIALALGCTSCKSAIICGSVGGLGDDIRIGDLLIVGKSICGDGFSRYLNKEIIPGDCFLQPVEPDIDLTRTIRTRASEFSRNKPVPVHEGTVFSMDSILGEIFRLEYFIKELRCIGIEMETAAFFRAAKLVGINAGALLQFSDVPLQKKSLYSGRTPEEKEYRKTVRQEILAKVVLESLVSE